MAEPRIAIDILVNCQTGTNNLKRFNKELNNTVNGANKITKTTNWLSKGLTRFIGAYFGIQTVKSIVNTYRNLDLIRRSIEGLTQSTQDWEYVQKEAFRTATDIETVAKGYRNFYSAATMAGMDKNSVQTMYSSILEAGRAVGATQPQIQGALLALEQMFSKGKVSMEELRRQLGNALPGAFEVAAKAMGVTTEQFNEMIKKGIQAKELVPKFTEEYRKTFEKSFPEAIKSLDAALVNLDNSWKLFQYNILYGETGKKFAESLVKISKFLQSKDALKLAEDIGKLFQLLVKCLGVIVNIGEYLLQIKPVLLIGGIILGIRGLNIELLITYGRVMKILAPLMFMEDLILGLGQHFAGWNVKSNFGDMLDQMLGKKGEDKSNRVELFGRNPDEDVLPSVIKNNKDLMKTYRRLRGRNDYEGISNFIQKWGVYQSIPSMRPTNMSTLDGSPGVMSLNKSQTLSMGDVTINVNGSGNPQETAYAVKDVLISMFTGQTGVTA